VKIN